MSDSVLRIAIVATLASILASVVLFVSQERILIQYHSHTVVRTQDKFIPETLVVTRGGTVTFINESSSLAWPASDIHPSHTTYPEFDPNRELNPGETWTFTFDREGPWQYHDHLLPNIIGEILVTKPNGVISDNKCLADLSSKECRTAFLADALQTGGLSAAFDALAFLHETQKDFALRCHLYTHDIGLRAYHKYKRDITLIPETKYCNAGFFHGYMEGLFSDIFDPKVADSFCSQVGEELRDSFPNAENQCRHGIGHGSMEAVLFSHPYLWSDSESLLKRGFAVCEQANSTYDQKMRCASGITSTFADWAMLHEEFSKYITPSTMLLHCAQQQDEFMKHGCYWGMAKRFFWVPESNQDYKRTLTLLDENFPKEDYEKYASMAIRSVASYMGREGVRNDPKNTIAACRVLPNELQIDCLRGMVESVMYAGQPGNEDRPALIFCASHLLSDDEARACYSFIVERMRWYDTDRLLSACQQIPSQYIQPEDCVEM